MNEFNFNYKGLNDNETCVCSRKLNNPHILQCPMPNTQLPILNNSKHYEYKYADILNGTLHQQKNILNIMKTNIANYRQITLASQANN